jgi:hypothetical protein
MNREFEEMGKIDGKSLTGFTPGAWGGVNYGQ